MVLKVEVAKIATMEKKTLELLKDGKIKFLVTKMDLKMSQNSDWFGTIVITTN